jgi:hypothetical protein
MRGSGADLSPPHSAWGRQCGQSSRTSAGQVALGIAWPFISAQAPSFLGGFCCHTPGLGALSQCLVMLGCDIYRALLD